MKQLLGLNMVIRDLDDRPILVEADGDPLKVTFALSSCLARGQSTDPMRAMKVAHDLMHEKKDSIDLDDQDVALLKKVVTEDRLYTNLVKAVLLAQLEIVEVVDEEPKKK